MDGEHERRCQAAQREMAALGIDYLVVTPSSDLIYLSGIASEPSERLLAFLLPSAGKPALVVPRLEAHRLAEAVPFAERLIWEETDDPVALLSRALDSGDNSHPVVAVGDQTWSLTLLRLQATLVGARFLPAGQLLGALRVCKSPGEVELLRQAGAMTDEAFARFISQPLAGKTEVEVAVLLSRLMREAGLESISFCIVGSGPNSAKPHHEPGQRRLVEGDTVVCDFGGTYRHYQSDMTRTLFVGTPPPAVSRVHAAVAEAQEAGYRAVRPGTLARAVDAAARDRLEAAGLGEYFIHRTGHGLGLDVHEEPYIVGDNPLLLREGMVFSVEPGAYLQGQFGVRVEDIVVVTDTGAERLNHSRRDLVALKP
ncbi:MAG: M24 family metallopeptidase [Chloroflexota bacterium]